MKYSVSMALLCLATAFPCILAQSIPPAQAAPGIPAEKAEKIPPSTPIAIAGDWIITLGDLQNRINQALPQIRSRYNSAEGRLQLINGMIDNRLLYLEAVQRGLDKDPVLRDRLQSFAEQLYGAELTKRLFQDITVSDQEAKAYYDAHPADFTTPEQVRARHILLKTEPEAAEVLRQLKQGTPFEELARSKSIDSRTAPAGGELGWFARGVMAPGFEKAAFGMEKDAISGVVASGFGFHIIQVEDKRLEQMNPFEIEKIRIISQLRMSKQRGVLETLKQKLRSDARVVIREELLQPVSQSSPDTTSRMLQTVPIKP